MAIDRIPKDYNAATYEKIISSLVRRIEVLESAKTVKKIGSLSQGASPLLNIGEAGYIRDNNSNVDLVIRADDGKFYRFSGLVTTSSSVPSSGGTTDHGALTGLSDDDHTQYVLRSIMTTKGDLFSYSTVVARLAVGSASQILIPDSTATTGLDWANLVFNNDVLIGNNDEIVTV